MFTDMVGYTALGQRNETLSLALVEEQRKVIRPILSRHNGREVKTIGDAFLVEFPNAVDAVRCAYDIQRSVREFNLSLAQDRRIHLRVGVHVGEVVDAQGDISGDAVNVASRIEPLAEDGGVCVTRSVYDFVRNKVDIPLSSVGMKPLKNVAEPMEVYKMDLPWEKEAVAVKPELDRNRVAVLPFANMSPDPEEGYFADGMTEEIITGLSKIRELRVTSRTSVMHYKGQTKRIPEIGKELSVGTVLEGSVRKAGNRVRVTVQMIDAAGDQHLWAENYDRTLEDIFAVQSEIAEKVAGELKVQLLQSERKTIEEKSTENMEAYSNFLRGRELLREGSEPSLWQALRLFEKAVALDPSFARAHVGVAECHQTLGNSAYEPREAMISAVKASLQEALQLNPDLAEAHASLAQLHFNEDDDQGATDEAQRALELNPSLPEPYLVLFEEAAIWGRPEEMVRDIETAYRLDPVRSRYIGLLGSVYLWTGMELEALEHWRKTEHLAPAVTYRWMTDYYLLKGDLAKAREYHAKVQKLWPTYPWVTYVEGFIDATAGEREKALLRIEEIEEKKLGPVAYNYIAYIYYALGDMDRYFENIEKALKGHVVISSEFFYSPLFAKAREDPRYPGMVQQIREFGLKR